MSTQANLAASTPAPWPGISFNRRHGPFGTYAADRWSRHLSDIAEHFPVARPGTGLSNAALQQAQRAGRS